MNKEQANENLDINIIALTEALTKIDIEISASESHGVLCGLLCQGAVVSISQWLNEALDGQYSESTDTSSNDILEAVYETSVDKITHMAFDLQPVLPDDNKDIQHRSQSLGLWCSGFLAGFGLAQDADIDSYTEDVQDVLSQFFEIADVNHEELYGDEESEKSFVEVLEYVRMATLLVYCEMTKTEESTDSDEKVYH